MNVPTTTIQVAYPVTVQDIATQLDGLRGLTFHCAEAYRHGVKAIAQCRDLRVKVEERRKFLKADSLAYGREVDRVAAQLVSAIEAVEGPLKTAKLEVDNQKAREKAEAEAAKRKAIEDELRAKREAEEARLKAIRQAEERALLEQRAELDKVRAEMAAASARAAEEKAELDALLAQVREEKAALDAAQRAQEPVLPLNAVPVVRLDPEELVEMYPNPRTGGGLGEAQQLSDPPKTVRKLTHDENAMRLYAQELRLVFEESPTLVDDGATQCLVRACNLVGEAITMLEEWEP